MGFGNVLEGCRHADIKHLVFASSSSVYGANTKLPFSEHDNVDHPVSLYAASKKANELMAHCYAHLYGLPSTGLRNNVPSSSVYGANTKLPFSEHDNVDHPVSLYAASKKANELMAHCYAHLYGLPCTGLRFFTVYGPWGRPDMALFKFTKGILEGVSIPVFNQGNMIRDFTYIDDIVEGVIRVIDRPAQPEPNWSGDSPDSATSYAPYRIYNIGNNRPVELMTYIQVLEDCLGKKAQIEFLPML